MNKYRREGSKKCGVKLVNNYFLRILRENYKKHYKKMWSTEAALISQFNTTLCEVLWWNHSRSVTKNLTPYRFNSAGWGLDGQNAEIHSFPTMYIIYSILALCPSCLFDIFHKFSQFYHFLKNTIFWPFWQVKLFLQH